MPSSLRSTEADASTTRYIGSPPFLRRASLSFLTSASCVSARSRRVRSATFSRSAVHASSSSRFFSSALFRFCVNLSANERTKASCAMEPKSQLRDSSASASSTSMPREMRQQLTMLPVRPMPALQCTSMGRMVSSLAISMNLSTASKDGGSMSVTGMCTTSSCDST